MKKLTLFLISFVSSVSFSKTSVVPNRILLGSDTKAALMSAMGTEILGPLNIQSLSANWNLVRYSSSIDAHDVVQMMKSLGIKRVQPDWILKIPENSNPDLMADFFPYVFNLVKPTPLPSEKQAEGLDPLRSDLWGWDKIQARSAQELIQSMSSVLVANIDTGIDYNHEDLRSVLNPEIGFDATDGTNLPWDDNDHGTHTAGIIAASRNNGVGILGVAPKVSLLSVKFLSGEGSGSTSDAIKAIDWAISKKARVLSNSWGGPADDDNPILQEAVARVEQAGGLFVAAAGNDGSDNDSNPMFPASFENPGVLSVASSQQKDTLSFFSNYGNRSVDVAAPGGGVLSTVAGGGYRKFSGTSMACPQVAGLAAILFSLKPSLTAFEVKKIILESSDAIPAMERKTVTGGRINVERAIHRLQLQL
jgi:subtilisin family serine protease